MKLFDICIVLRLIFSLVIYFIFLIVIQELVISKIMKNLNNKILVTSKLLKFFNEKINDLKRVRSELKFITKIISYFEAIFITILSFVFFNYSEDVFKAIMPILTVVAGWMAIKIIGNYSQWNDYAMGRSAYYVFLIGSLINIIIAIVCGFLFSVAY